MWQNSSVSLFFCFCLNFLFSAPNASDPNYSTLDNISSTILFRFTQKKFRFGASMAETNFDFQNAYFTHPFPLPFTKKCDKCTFYRFQCFLRKQFRIGYWGKELFIISLSPLNPPPVAKPREK